MLSAHTWFTKSDRGCDGCPPLHSKSNWRTDPCPWGSDAGSSPCPLSTFPSTTCARGPVADPVSFLCCPGSQMCAHRCAALTALWAAPWGGHDQGEGGQPRPSPFGSDPELCSLDAQAPCTPHLHALLSSAPPSEPSSPVTLCWTPGCPLPGPRLAATAVGAPCRGTWVQSRSPGRQGA